MFRTDTFRLQVLEKSCSPDAMAAKSQQRAYHFSLITRGIRALRSAGLNLQAVLGDHAERLGVSSFTCARPVRGCCNLLAPFCTAVYQPYQAIIARSDVHQE